MTELNALPDGTYYKVADGIYSPLTVAQGYWVAYKSIKLEDGDSIADGQIFGVWQANGTTYLDLTAWVRDRQTAIDLAKQFDQIAIWDCANAKEIYIINRKAN